MKYFKPTNWAIDHKVPVYIFIFAVTILGIISYISLPKEQFPDIVIPTIYVQTIYPGTSPVDIENLVTRPIEKQLKSVRDINKVTSQSLPDVSVVIVEFETNVKPSEAKQRVADAVDKAKSELPNDLLKDPIVQEIDFSEFPISYVNISGNLEPARLKDYAEDLQDKIEALKEITRVDLIGAPEREIQVNLDLIKLQTTGLTFSDVERGIAGENVNISGGEYVEGGVRRNLRLTSQFTNMDDIKNIVVKSATGSTVYLRDIAEIKDSFKEQLSFARLNGEPVISLSIIKKSGENLINAADKIEQLISEYQKTLPKSVKITITGDRSISTRTNLSDLVNSVIIGFILVTIILMFFLGVRDSVFVALSVPISSFLAFLMMPALGFSFNIVVTFTFLLAIGIVVDDAIVVIENTHRLFTTQGYPIKQAAKRAAGEVFVPVLTGTLTTLAPFIPLLFFPGIAGKFMFYLPVIMIITLIASLIVAYIINPMLAAEFMGRPEGRHSMKRMHTIAAVFAGLAVLFYLVGFTAGGNILILLVILGYLNRFLISPILIKGFQEKFRPRMMGYYKSTLRFALKGRRPYFVMLAMVGLFIVTIVLFAMFPPSINFFPSGDPNFVYVYVKMPIGTDAVVTDSVTHVLENRVNKILGRNNPVVNSVISNVGVGAGDPSNPDRSVTPYKGKITVAFVEYAKRGGVSTQKYLDEIRDKIKHYPGAEIRVDKEQNGPATGKPVNVEISGDNLDELQKIESTLNKAIDEAGIQGIEGLTSDLQLNKPEILLEVDRTKANVAGLSSAQVGMAIRTAIFGTEASKFRDEKDEYPIQVRLEPRFRDDISAILNMPITYRDMASGQVRQIPIASVTRVSYVSTYAGLTHKDQKRTITLSSNVLSGYNASQINSQIMRVASTVPLPAGYTISMTGEQEQQQEASAFLGQAFMISIFLILIILVLQFNSVVTPFIILTQVLFSTIGVFLGFLFFRFTMSVVITGVGIVALAGIVVKNGIILIDFIEIRKKHGDRIRHAIVESGATRFNPVVLTAFATTSGVVPLALGININFASLLSRFDPEFFMGGDTAAFWGPLAWAIIFGLLFATFLTLVVVPCMYFIQYAFKVRYARARDLRRMKEQSEHPGRFGPEPEPGFQGK